VLPTIDARLTAPIPILDDLCYRVLFVVNSITQSVTIPVILQKKNSSSRKDNFDSVYTAHLITCRVIWIA